MRFSNGFSGGMDSFRIGPGSISPVIKYLIIINVLIYIAQVFISKAITGLFGLSPLLFYRDFPNYIFQPLTYMFLHGGMLHLFFNMFALWMFGTEIEYHWGSRNFLKYYLYCGLGGALFSLIFNYNSANTIVGASGAIYGILAAYWLMFPDRYLLIFFMFPMKVRYAIPFFAVLTFLFSGTHVAHLAHLGGAVIGLIYLKLDWRFAALPRWIKSLRFKRKTAKLEKQRQKAEDIMKRVDAILDKINEVGIENISKEDRKFLENASQILSKEDK